MTVTSLVRPFDAASHKVLQKIDFQVPGVRRELIEPVGIRLSKDDELAFVALGPANRVALVDTKTFEVMKYIQVGQRPWHMELHPDGSKLYVATYSPHLFSGRASTHNIEPSGLRTSGTSVDKPLASPDPLPVVTAIYCLPLTL